MKNADKPGELSTILGRGSVVHGNIKVEHSLRIDGKVKGDVTSTDSLIIGAEGEVTGNLSVKNLVLGGKVYGSVVAPGRTVLENKAEFYGDIKTSKLVIDEGAVFDGKCTMTEAGKGGMDAKKKTGHDEESMIK
jgi:cytoskeletal protein CcmA (bactofilin family)